MQGWQLGVLGAWMLVLTVYDVRTLRLPNAWLAAGAAIAVTGAILTHEPWRAVSGLGVGILAMVLVSTFWPFEAGDHKMAGMAGAFLGPWVVLLAILVALGIFAGYCWVRQPKRRWMPFAPFFSVGLTAAVVAVEACQWLFSILPTS